MASRQISRPLQPVVSPEESISGILRDLRACTDKHGRELEMLILRNFAKGALKLANGTKHTLDLGSNLSEGVANSHEIQRTKHTSDFGGNISKSDSSSHEVQLQSSLVLPAVCPKAGTHLVFGDGVEVIEEETNNCDQEQQAERELPVVQSDIQETQKSNACSVDAETDISKVVTDASDTIPDRSRTVSTFHSNMDKGENLKYRNNGCACVVKMRWFDNLCACFIVSSSLLIGLEVQFKTASNEWIFDVISNTYSFLFFVELILRMGARGKMFFFGIDKNWNFFDMFCVASSVLEITMDIILKETGGDGSVLLIIRAMRVVRMARIIRVIRFLSKLRMMVFSLFGALRMLGWALLLLSMIMYMFAVTFTEASKPILMRLDGNFKSEEEQLLEKHFKSLWRTMLTLFQSIAGGVSWGEPLSALAALSDVYVYAFLIYICLVVLAMLNVLTGLCCDYAIQNAVSDRDDAIRAQLKDKEKWQQQFESMFKAIDSDGSGEVSGDELAECLQDEEFQAYLAHLNVSVDDAFDLLELFDKDGTGTIGIDEFVTGCMRVKGHAKTIDLMKILKEVGNVHEDMLEMMRILADSGMYANKVNVEPGVQRRRLAF